MAQIDFSEYLKAVDTFISSAIDNNISLKRKGHYQPNIDSILLNQIRTELLSFVFSYSDESKFIQLIENSANDEILLPKSSFLTCTNCGNPVQWKLTYDQIIAHEECNYPDGYPELELIMDTPSQKIIIGNDFRKIVGAEYYSHYDLNTDYGCGELSKHYLRKYDMIHCYIGNTCPDIYSKDGIIKLMLNGGKYSGEDFTFIVPSGDKIGQITTDLWWFSVMDYSRFQSLRKDSNLKCVLNPVVINTGSNRLKVTWSIKHTRAINLGFKEGKGWPVTTLATFQPIN